MQYSIFRAPYYSFFSKEFYSETAKRGKGTGFLYLLLILLVCYPLSVYGGYYHFLGLLESPSVKEITDKLPDMSVKNGVLSINKPSPYTMEFKNATTQEKSIIVFDTSGNEKLPDDAKALVTAKGIVIDNDQPPVTWVQLGKENFDFPASRFKEMLAKIVLFIAYGSLLLLPLVYIGHLLLALLYAGIGMIMDRRKMGYSTALRMTCVAMTPSIVITTLFYILFGSSDMVVFLLLWELVSIPVTLGYLLFGYSAIGAPPAETVS